MGFDVKSLAGFVGRARGRREECGAGELRRLLQKADQRRRVLRHADDLDLVALDPEFRDIGGVGQGTRVALPAPSRSTASSVCVSRAGPGPRPAVRFQAQCVAALRNLPLHFTKLGLAANRRDTRRSEATPPRQRRSRPDRRAGGAAPVPPARSRYATAFPEAVFGSVPPSRRHDSKDRNRRGIDRFGLLEQRRNLQPGRRRERHLDPVVSAGTGTSSHRLRH